MELIEIEKWQRDSDLENLEGFRHGTRQAPTLYRTGMVKASQGDGPMVFIASDEGPDRFGDSLTVDGWDLQAFQANPVFLWFHGMDENHLLPIGRIPKVWPEEKQLLAMVEWDPGDGFAAEVQGKYRRGFLKAVSVGFRPLEFEEMKADGEGTKEMGGGIKFLKQELLEVSAVPVPANPRALQRAKAWNMREARKAVFPMTFHTQNGIITITASTEKTTTMGVAKEPKPDPLAPIAKAMREFNEALRGPGGK